MITIYGQVPSKSNGYRVVVLNGHGSLTRSDALVRYAASFYDTSIEDGVTVKKL